MSQLHFNSPFLTMLFFFFLFLLILLEIWPLLSFAVAACSSADDSSLLGWLKGLLTILFASCLLPFLLHTAILVIFLKCKCSHVSLLRKNLPWVPSSLRIMSRFLNLEIQGHIHNQFLALRCSLTSHHCPCLPSSKHWALCPLTSTYCFPYGPLGFPPHRLPFHLLILSGRWSYPISPRSWLGKLLLARPPAPRSPALTGFLEHCCQLVAVCEHLGQGWF